MYAAASGHINTMRLLLDVGKVDVNELHMNGRSALLLEAVTGGAGEVMQFLLERGARPDLVDLDGVTPLHAVTSKGDYTRTDRTDDSHPWAAFLATTIESTSRGLPGATSSGQLAPSKYARRDIFAVLEMTDDTASRFDVVSDASTGASPLVTMAVGNVGGDG
jgi:hypothetical protein